MILKFIFLYKHSNKDYFLKIMRKTATGLDLKHYDMILGNELLFFVNGDDENLSNFATQISYKIPLSLYFILKSVEVSKEMMKGYSSTIDEQSCTFDFDLSETINIKDINGEQFCDIFTYPNSKINIDILFDNKSITTKDKLKDSLNSITKMLQNGESVRFQTIKGEIILSLNNRDFDFILSNDISTINLYTRATQNELDALATFEKPYINLYIKEVFVNELGFKNALFILPYDPILCALSSILIDLEIPFLFANYDNGEYKKHKIKNGIDYINPFKERFFEIVMGENGYFIENKFLDSTKDSNITKYGLIPFIQSNFDTNTPLFVAYISTYHQTIFKILDSNANIINIHFDMNPKNILKQLSLRPNGKKLLENYEKSFPDRIHFINSFSDEEIWSDNILDIFSSICVILGFSKILEKDRIFEYASLSLRDIGPRIDFKIINSDGEANYDYLASVSSSISFTLAGIDNETLCYGILDSLADFVINVFRDANTNYGIKDIGIIGDLFVNRIFFSKITKKFPQDLILHFPDYIDQM
ncbi:hypothetical protein CCY99_05420 [Helicobacter sp. 16-1353]|uniref:hypothetical protein n=1 Tax=Helicobacter sp. 16-1353 TaxID=2004996 RepID=UPI000DCF0086|nr:hypothetical protein [Helicobacter sp. 16-1353]RAX53823.1 hypothetical protein CCY99_05420 [Helicobacter sp. 16-1353]